MPAHDDRHDDIEETIHHAKAMGRRALALRHRGLEAVPAALAGLDELLELDLTGNALAAVPDAVLALARLEFLTLCQNRLSALPGALWELTALKELDLGNAVSLGPDQRYGPAAAPGGKPADGNRIAELPAGLGALTALRRLGAGFAGLRTLPAEIGALKQLVALELPGNALETLPPAINALARLETLDLSANPLAGLPDGLAGLEGLRSLRLGDVADPPALAPLKGLEMLVLPGCGLEALPDWVLALEGLTSLYLAGNPMIDLPEGIAALRGLSYLDLTATGITEPPRHLALPDRLIVRLGPQRFYQGGQLGHAIGPGGSLTLLDDRAEDDDEETLGGPLPSRPSGSRPPEPRRGAGLGQAGGVIIHRPARRDDRDADDPAQTAAAGGTDEEPTRIVRRTSTPASAPSSNKGDSAQTRRGAPGKSGLAARVQAAVADSEREHQGGPSDPGRKPSPETGGTTSRKSSGETTGETTGGPATPAGEDTGATRMSAPKGGLAARVRAAVEDGAKAGPGAGDATKMGQRAAARAGQASAGGDDEPAAPENLEETVSQPRGADGRPLRKGKRD
ncbi:MAG TPA: hypothetical protein VM325_09795 [Alphaproteobacteria bacterium]|nr:hypothetical protein [Alphaproteobacteria bacterium]